MSLSQSNIKSVSIDLKLNNSDLSGNTTELNAPTLTYIVYTIRDGMCQNLSF